MLCNTWRVFQVKKMIKCTSKRGNYKSISCNKSTVHKEFVQKLDNT